VKIKCGCKKKKIVTEQSAVQVSNKYNKHIPGHIQPRRAWNSAESAETKKSTNEIEWCDTFSLVFILFSSKNHYLLRFTSPDLYMPRLAKGSCAFLEAVEAGAPKPLDM
jgi:hypothetical protein